MNSICNGSSLFLSPFHTLQSAHSHKAYDLNLPQSDHHFLNECPIVVANIATIERKEKEINETIEQKNPEKEDD